MSHMKPRDDSHIMKREMMPASGRVKAALSILGAAVLVTSSAGCSLEDAQNKGSTKSEPVKGGILKVGANGDIDRLDPALTAYVPVSALMRSVTRQLVSYETAEDESARIAPKGDLATEVPAPTDDGRAYTFKLREGVQWDTPNTARPIIAEDVERGIKRLCNPYQASAHVSYFSTLIKGMDEFCEGFSGVSPEPAAMKEYIEKNDIAGISTPDHTTVRFDLKEQAGDFVYMLSLAAATPAPVEVLEYLPDSPEYRSNFIASGPYRVASYTPDKALTLERNPSWTAASDPLRAAHVDGVEMTMGLSSDAVTQQLQTGSLDMAFDTTISSSVAQQLRAAADPKISTVASGQVNPFIWVNTKTGNNNGALKNLKVRQALQYAVNKAAVVQTLGGTENTKVQHGIFGPGILGFHEFNLYPTPDDKGDPAKAKQLLAEAGYANGLKLKMPYRTKDLEAQIAQTIQASFGEAGIEVELIPVNPTDYYSKFLTNRSSTADGAWDIAPVGWTPDWQGGAARSVFQPQFTFEKTPQTYNYMDYNNAEATALAAKAIAAENPEESAKLWGEVDEKVMSDAVVIPIAAPKAVLYHSKRVQNFLPYALSVQGDWANVWLEK